MDALLSVEGISVHYGGVQALANVSFSVAPGEIAALIGANGAGKSTVLRAVSGIVRPQQGRILYDGEEIAGLPPHRIVRTGIVHVPEGRGIFGNLSVKENLEMGAYTRRRREGDASSFERVFALFPRLADRLRQPAGTLSGGEQQMLAIGRALMASPRLILLDEPSMGLSPLLVEEIFRLILDINAAGTTVLLVEQNAWQALHVAGRACVLEAGRVVLAGEAAALRDDPKVRVAYLGDVA